MNKIWYHTMVSTSFNIIPKLVDNHLVYYIYDYNDYSDTIVNTITLTSSIKYGINYGITIVSSPTSPTIEAPGPH